MSTPRSVTLPAVARAVTLDTAFGPVAALRTDPADTTAAHATVLLIPGFTGSKEDFLALLEPLTAAGYPVVAVDQRGQYQSVGPEQVDDESYSLERFAEEACAIAAAIGGGVHVVGHSFGGLVAQAMALTDHRHVRSLTLLCTGPAALPPEQRADLATFVVGLPLVGKAAAWTLMRERSAATREPATPEVDAFLLERFLTSSTGSLVGIATILQTAPDRVDELARLGIPVHVAYGENDDAWPLETQRAMAARLGAPLTVVIGAGHSPNVDAPEATSDAIVGFLSAVESEGTG